MDAVGSKPVAGGTALQLVDEFAAFGPCYMKWVRSRLGEGGISYARMRLLGALHCGGPQIMSSISDELGVTRRNVTALVDALAADAKRFTPGESWNAVRDTLLAVADQSAEGCGALVLDTVALLDGVVTPEDYRSKWVSTQEAPLHGIVF